MLSFRYNVADEQLEDGTKEQTLVEGNLDSTADGTGNATTEGGEEKKIPSEVDGVGHGEIEVTTSAGGEGYTSELSSADTPSDSKDLNDSTSSSDPEKQG